MDDSPRPEPPIHDRIARLAAGQHGVVTRAQLLAAGLSSRMVDTRVSAGRLRPIHRGVYLIGSLQGPLEPERAPAIAAAFACGPAAVVSHRTAGWLWAIQRRPDPRSPVDVTVPAGARRRRPGIRVHRSRDLTSDETTRLDGIPVTTPARTLRDLATVLGTRELNRAAARAERLGLVVTETLAAALERHRGRRGVPLLRATILDDAGPTLTRSEAEERFLDLVRCAELPLPRTNVVVRGHEVDFLWPDGIAVEVDGFAFHGSRRSFENDRRRDADLAASGVHVLRITWRQIVREPTPTMVRIGQALARRTPTER